MQQAQKSVEAWKKAKEAGFSDQTVKEAFNVICSDMSVEIRNCFVGIGMCRFKMVVKDGESKEKAFNAGMDAIAAQIMSQFT